MPVDSSTTFPFPSEYPADAYAADLARLHRRQLIGSGDDAWVVLAQTLHRLRQLAAPERESLYAEAADALAASAVAAGLPQDTKLLCVAGALRDLHLAAAATEPAAMHALTMAVQAATEDLELAGAFNLAYVTLESLRGLVAGPDVLRREGGVLLQQARVARVAGVSDLARSLYDTAIDLAYDCDAFDLVARGLIGLGNLAMTRGNYPEARTLFERCLANAERAGDPEMIRLAHQGLLVCAHQAKDLDSAMIHAWNVLRLSLAPDSRAEALSNIGEVCLLANEPAVGLRVYRLAYEWSTVPDLRYHALNGELQCCAALERREEAVQALRRMDEIAPSVHDVHSVASLTVEVADALLRLGDASEAAKRLNVAMQLATQYRLNAVVFEAEAVAQKMNIRPAAAPVVADPRARPHRQRRSEQFQMVLRSLRGLAAETL